MMLVGIISDTHDNMPMVQKAVDIFSARKVEHVLHAGDFTSPFVFRILKKLECPFTGIFGNNDGEKLLLCKLSNDRIFTQPYIFELAGKKIVMMHEHHIADALADSGHYNMVVYGHTHEPDIRKMGKTLIINPGETCGWLYGKPTVAIVDLQTLSAEVIELEIAANVKGQI